MKLNILGLFLLLSTILSAQVQKKLDVLALDSAMIPGQLSFHAVNLTTGETIASYDSGKRIRPASTLKTLTCYAIIDLLGPEHVFTTKVGASGKVNADGVLIGDLIIEAGGDPALGAEKFLDDYGSGAALTSQVIAALREAGVKTIQGSILIDESIYSGNDVPDEWTWQDMGNYYAAGAHAFTYRENMFVAELQSTDRVGSSTKLRSVRPELPGVTWVNEVHAASINGDEAYFYGAPSSQSMYMRGQIPLNKKSFSVKGAMPDPAAVFKAALMDKMEKMGISVQNAPTETKVAKDEVGSIMVQEFLRFESPSLERLIAHTLMTSDNLFAEHFIRHISLSQGGDGSFSHGLDALKVWAKRKGLNTNAITLKDGSGLSRSNAVTAEFMVALLAQLNSEPYFERFTIGLPIAGRSGSLRRIGKGSAIDGKLMAKSGYIESARGYAGYVMKGESIIVFSILAEDYLMSPSAMRKRMEEIMIELGN